MIQTIKDLLIPRGLELLVHVLSAILVYMVGRWVIWGMRKAARRAIQHRNFDPTVARYIDQSVGVVLTVVLVLVALGVLGVQTASLAGLLAAAGVAIGVAWSGLLSNLVAGVFMVVFRPFKKGDNVQIGGVYGTVEELGLFGTTLTAFDGTKVVVGNTKAFSDNIHNLSAVPHRRVEARAQLPWGCDTGAFYAAVRARLSAETKVLREPAMVIETIEHNAAGPVATVRPYCAPSDYADVLFLTHRIIGEEVRKAGIEAPSALLGIK